MANNAITAVVALGANLSLREQGPKVTLERAIDAMETAGLVIRAKSRFFSTPCFPAGAGPDYVNAAVVIETRQSPEDVLTVLHKIEDRFGRQRVQRWGMRTLDLDLVCWESRVLPDLAVYNHWRSLPATEQANAAPDQLILPHPRLQDRAFVLVPMAELMPDWCHPVLGQTVQQMLDELPAEERTAIRPL